MSDVTDSRENRVLITVSCGTNNPNRSVRAFHLAQVAHGMGKEVAVFLLDEAVYLARKGIAENLKAPTGDIADDLIAYLQEFEVPIYACAPCAKTRQIEEKDLMDGFEMAPATKMWELACESTTISL
ncbi:MAG: DsrE family protein [Deltaproteobacteria bacterium]|nr:DsrE family protein [Deltaproteobacteria bacterium]